MRRTICRTFFRKGIAMLAALTDNSYVTLAGGQIEELDLHEPLTHAFQDKSLFALSTPASTERSSQGLFAFLDRTTSVKSGPAWAASHKHRHWDSRPVQAVRPVSEGPQMPTGRVVKTNRLADGIAASWARWDVSGDMDHLGGARKPVVGFHPWGTFA